MEENKLNIKKDILEEEWTPFEEKAYQKDQFKKYTLFLGCFIIIILIIFGGYRTYPFLSKVQGSWESTSQGNYEININKSRINLSINNYKGLPGTSLRYEGEIYGAKVNRYYGKNVKMYLDIQKKEWKDEDWEAILNNQKQYQVIKNTNKELILRYSKKAIEKAYEETNGIENIFYVTLKDFKGVNGETLLLRNKQFAENGLEFVRKEK